VRIRIQGHDLPGSACGPGPDYPDGHPDIHVAVQRRNKPGELCGMVRGDAAVAEWELECTATAHASGVDLKGPFLQGGPGARFIYLSWGVVDEEGVFTMFRRAKLMLDGVPPDVLRRAVETGTLTGRIGLTDEKGNPSCAAMRPPLIDWTAGTS
jgi:Family of unknown function (DUF5990)